MALESKKDILSINEAKKARKEWLRHDIKHLSDQKIGLGKFYTSTLLANIGFIIATYELLKYQIGFLIVCLLFIIVALLISISLATPSFFDLTGKESTKKLYDKEVNCFSIRIKLIQVLWGIGSMFFIIAIIFK